MRRKKGQATENFWAIALVVVTTVSAGGNLMPVAEVALIFRTGGTLARLGDTAADPAPGQNGGLGAFSSAQFRNCVIIL